LSINSVRSWHKIRCFLPANKKLTSHFGTKKTYKKNSNIAKILVHRKCPTHFS
jgi:hypothetical protein